MKSYDLSLTKTSREIVHISISSAGEPNGANGPCTLLALDPVQFSGMQEDRDLTEDTRRKYLVDVRDLMRFDSDASTWRVRRFFIPQDKAHAYLEAMRLFERAFSA